MDQVKKYAESMRVIDIAADISEGLARVATAGEVNGEVVDLRTVVEEDCELSILTFQDENGKGAFRHTASHIMAQAIKTSVSGCKTGDRTIRSRWILL